MLPFLFLAACSQAIIQPLTEPCVDWTFSEEAEPYLEYEVDGDTIILRRNGVTLDCEATFNPRIEPDGRVIRVFEAWDEEDACELRICYAPTVSIGPVGGGTFTVHWFDDSSDVIPVESIEVSTR